MDKTPPILELAGMQEIPLPGPVSYLPQTIGWYVLFALVLAGVVWLMWRWYRHYQANRYRTVALHRLQHIAHDLQDAGKRAAALAMLPVLVKRTTLVFSARETVAALSGDRWLKFLDSTFKGAAFSSGAGRLLPDLAYGSPEALQQIPNDKLSALTSLLKQWIKEHHVPI